MTTKTPTNGTIKYIGVIIALATILIGLAVTWGTIKNTVENNEKDVEAHEVRISQLERNESAIKTTLENVEKGIDKIQKKLDN